MLQAVWTLQNQNASTNCIRDFNDRLENLVLVQSSRIE